MGPDAQRIGELGQEGVEARGEGERERFERGRPRRVVRFGLGVEREEPGPAIGALEGGGVGAIEEGAFARDFFGDEHGVGARADPGGDGEVREAAREAEDLPPAVDTAVPVETAVKDRVMLAGRLGVLGGAQDEVHLVGIFAAEVGEGGGREADGVGGGEVH